MATYGQLQEFQPETASIVAYLERMDMYLLANAIPEEEAGSSLLECDRRKNIRVTSRPFCAGGIEVAESREPLRETQDAL